MNELLNTKGGEKTISSVELAEISGREHKSIMRSIETMNKDLFEMMKAQAVPSSYTSQQGKLLPCFILTIYQCELLALALDWKSRIKVLDKIEELREIQNKPLTYEEIMKNALVLADQRVKSLEVKIEEDKPKVEFANTVADSSDVILVREYAKMLCDEKWIDIWEKRLFKWFRENSYLNKKNEPYQASMKWFKIIETTVTSIFWTRINKTTKVTGHWQLYFLPKLKAEYGNNTQIQLTD